MCISRWPLLSAAFTCCLLIQAKRYGGHAAALTTCGKSRNADPSRSRRAGTVRDDKYKEVIGTTEVVP